MALYELKQHYPRDIDKQLHLLSIEKNDGETKLIGSMSYRINNASDVDFYERIKQQNRDDVINFFTVRIREIVNNLSKMNDQYFFEVKAGKNPAFANINIGQMANGIYIFPSYLMNLINKLVNMGFFKPEDVEPLKNLHIERTQKNFEIVYELFRKLIILRWNKEEINKGYKELKDIEGKIFKYKFIDAIQDKTACNIEEIFINSENNFCESSNYYQLVYEDENRILHGINANDSILNNFDVEFRENLKNSMYKLLYSKLPKNYNPLKAVKRLFSYARYTKSEVLYKSVRPILESQVGYLYSFISQLKTLSKVLENPEKKKVSEKILDHQIDYICWKLQGNILDIPNAELIINNLYNLIGNSIPDEQKIIIIDNAISFYMTFINKYVMKRLVELCLFPLPENLMPKIRPF